MLLFLCFAPKLKSKILVGVYDIWEVAKFASGYKLITKAALAQMANLIETMRREGYEFMVSKPKVITIEEDGKTMEPVENVYLDLGFFIQDY